MKTGPKRYAVDANVIVRFFTRDVEELWAKAHALMQQMSDGKIVLVSDPAVLSEVVWVLSSFYELEAAEIGELLEPLLAAEGFEIPNKGRYLSALAMYGSVTRDWGDACLCAAALENCEGRVVSFDHGIKNIEGITRMDSV